MTESVQFFDPRPPVGWLYDGSRPDQPLEDLPSVELLDATLPGSGRITLEIGFVGDAAAPRTVILKDVRECADGGLALHLDDGRRLVFATAQRERVTAIILKLANNYY